MEIRPITGVFFCCMAVLPSMLGCSVVHIAGTYQTQDDLLCVVPPEIDSLEVHRTLVERLRAKEFKVIEKPAGTPPSACRQTLLYVWSRKQYYVPAVVKQYGISLRVYVDGQYRANASFDPTRNLISPQVKYIPFSRYLARALDHLFPGRPLISQ